MRLNVKKALVTGAVCLGLWMGFTYVTFANRPLGLQPGEGADYVDVLEQRVGKLEKELDSQLESNKETLLLIKEKLKEQKIKKETEQQEANAVVIPVLLLACNRVTVRRCLEQLMKYRPSAQQFPIIISQDCGHKPTYEVLQQFAALPEAQVTLITQPDGSPASVPPQEAKFRGYFHIARHYRFALNHTFHVLNHRAVIIVEDDLDIAPDFYEYFLGTYPLLEKDPTLWCVSAWNDNGKPGLVDTKAPALLHRSDFFPGLGWMLRRELWAELEPKWPSAYWDDWIRKPEQRLDRACIRPELSRTRTFGKVGVSNGLFFDKHLKLIQLSTQSVPFTSLNLSYLLKDSYDKFFSTEVYGAPLVTVGELQRGEGGPGPLRLSYSTKEQYHSTARKFGLMDDFRSGVGRTAYQGVVGCFFHGRRLYIAPDPPRTVYDPNWS